MSQAIASIKKNIMEKIFATLGEYQGKPRIDIRTYYQPKQTGPDNWLPTKKGINLSPDNWKEFKKKVDRAIENKTQGGR